MLVVHQEQFKSALEALDIFMTEEDISKLFYVMDMDDNEGLDLLEFRKAIKVNIPEIFRD